MRQKGFILLPILIIIVLLGIIGYFYYKNYLAKNEVDVTNLLTKWNKYSNRKLGIDLSYPSSWSIIAQGDPTIFPVPIIASPCDKDSNQNCASLLIEKNICTKEMVCQRIANSDFYSIVNLQNQNISNVDNVQIDEEKAIVFDYKEDPIAVRGDGGKIYNERIYIINHNGTTYQLFYSEWGKVPVYLKDWKYLDILEKIVKSLRFTE